MAKLPPQFQKDFSGGMVTNINENLVPKNSVALAVNGVFDEEIGSFVTRLGSTLENQLSAGKSCLGLHYFRDESATQNHRLIAFFNDATDTNADGYQADVGSTITGLTNVTKDVKYRMITFQNQCLILNSTTPRALRSDGVVITTGGVFDLSNFPVSAAKVAIEWLDRVYTFGGTANRDRLYYSGAADNGAISWTIGNGYVDIEPEDGGGGLTALGKVPGYLLIFKERSLKRWNFDSAFPETLIQIGTPSHESVINTGGICAFYSASSDDTRGFYITNGGDPVCISQDRAKGVKKWVDAIPASAEEDVAGFGTRRYLMWSIGDVTVDGVDYKNVVLRWNKSLDQWSVWSFPTRITRMSWWIDNGVDRVVAGDDDGNVFQINVPGKYTDYDGSPIRYEVRMHDEKFGYNQKKELSEKLIIESIGMEGADVELVDEAGNIMMGGRVQGRVTELPLEGSMEANVLSCRIRGTVNGERGILKEVEYPNINVNQTYGD